MSRTTRTRKTTSPWIAREATCGEARRLAVEHAHKRLPVFDQQVDRIIGTLNVLDLLPEDPQEPIAAHIRETRYVPGSISVERLLSDIRKGSGFTAVVIDEFGAAEGIVMLEDILEVIVGELEDEFDLPQTAWAWIRELGARDYLVEARVTLDRLRQELGIELPSGPYDTLAGFLIETNKAIPPVGTVIQQDGISFTVERVAMPTALEVRVRW